MSPSTAAASASPAAQDNPYVVPEHLTDEQTGRGPRFWDAEWDFGPFVPRTVTGARVRFARLTDVTAQTAAREFLLSRITRSIPSKRRPNGGFRPMKLTWVHQEFDRFASILEDLAELGVTRLAEVTPAHLDALVHRWRTKPRKVRGPRRKVTDRRQRARHDKPSKDTPISTATLATRITVLKHLAEHRRFMNTDALTFTPWPGRNAKQVAEHVADSEENSTPRIAEAIMAPLLEAAIFYVTTASADILAARAEMDALDAADEARDRLGFGEAARRIRAYIQARRVAGRGIPALPVSMLVRMPEVPVIDGIVQAPNLALVSQQADVAYAFHYRQEIWDAGVELGWEEGGMDTAMSVWPATGQPWRPRLSRPTLNDEIFFLRIASWVVIAYLSGMRDCEVRELRRDCAITTQSADGRPRYLLHGNVFKGRELTGEEADWVVLEIVHQAVRVLQKVNDDPTHLFGYVSQLGHYTLLDTVTGMIDDFRDHLNDLFSTPNAPYIPDHDGAKWFFTTRQFRRTLAWHIAHQPFGVVAGTRQYKHAQTQMFEGYAGTSASGFAAEVTAEEAVAMLDYLEELYIDWDAGHASTGGAAARIGAEFDRIRRELGDLPGVVADTPRLRVMLAHLAKTLHPGVLNDCFFAAATAVCVKRAKIVGRPVPQHNMCLHCPNARRSKVHLPALIMARDQAIGLHQDCQRAGTVPKPQEIAITGYIAELDQIIAGLDPPDTKGTS